VTDAADPWKGGLTSENVRGILAVKPGLGDHDRRKPVAIGDLVDISGFADRVCRVPLSLDVDAPDKVEPPSRATMISDRVAAPQGLVVAIAERDGWSIL
jgi:hypothetical protein